ncbi:MAG: tetraacyldisaccharide 4'-kinase [Pseudomonadota bacterium]
MSEHLNILYGFGRPLSPFYGLAMSIRAAFYKKGIFRKYKLPVPVVSVGNLTLGGTGKTPMAIYLAKLLHDNSPVIVSRGYGGRAKGRVNVVSDGNEIYLDALAAGDEPFYMAENLPGVPVVTSRKRVDGGHFAVNSLHAKTVILDDGFQHQSLERDLDLVLFKVDSFLGNNRIFPGGDMRESLKALGRADGFVLTCVNDNNHERAEAIKRALTKKFPQIPVFMAGYQPCCLVTADKKEIPLEKARQMNFFGFCGLGQPDSFMNSLDLAGIRTAGFQVFRDHCRYFKPELEFLKKKIAGCRAEALITTEKDLVKIQGKELPLPLYALRMEVCPEAAFGDFVRARVLPTS